MKARTGILLLLGAVAGLFLLALAAIRHLEIARFEEIATRRAADWRRAVVLFLETREAPLATMARHYAALDGMVNAIADSDSEWLSGRLTREALAAYDANAIWILGPEFTPVHAVINHESAGGAETSLPGRMLAHAFEGRRHIHFFSHVPGGPEGAGTEKLIEVFGASVHPAWDADGTTEAQGYLLVGRLWDAARVERMAQITDNEVRLLPSPGADSQDAGSLHYSQPLPGIDGQPVAVLSVRRESPELDEMASRSRRAFATLAVVCLAVFGLLSMALLRSIDRPLQRMMQSLKTKDLRMIRQLEDSQSEFGELARLISRFYEQRENLLREMTERVRTEHALRESEERLRHSQKLEAMGRLAGGIAHDFNNLLTAIIGYADLSYQTAETARDREYSRLVVEAGERAAALTRQLLAFSRKQVLEVRRLDLNELVVSMEKMLRRIIGEHIELESRLEAQDSCICADETQIEQVLLNLGVNARDAMPEGGSLMLRTMNEDIEHSAGPGDLPVGRYIVLMVSDTGIGMDAEIQSRIFEPFFTTKGSGKGTGLGLATVYGIVQQSGGSISVRSEPGQGSTFKVFLPVADGEVERAPEPAAAPAMPARAGTVVLAEDEEVVREYIQSVLVQDGYRVLCASSGREALRLATEERGRIDLLITDVIMPQMNGPALAREMQEHYPELQVLFVSGYSPRDLMDRGLGDAEVELLAKPFTRDMLRERVARLLGS